MAVLLGIAVAAGQPFLHAGPHHPDGRLPWWVLAIVFALTEGTLLHRQVARHARSVSLSELPLVVGLFCATAVDVLVGWLVGFLVVVVLERRHTALKVVFNLALVTASTAVAVAVFHGFVELSDGNQLVVWLGAYAAAVALNALGDVAVGVVIAVHEGGVNAGRLLREAVVGAPAGPVVVIVALAGVTSWTADSASIWLFVLVGVLLLRAYRVFAALADRHRDLEDLYRFSQAVGDASDVDLVLHTVLAQVVPLLRAERAEIAVVGTSGGVSRLAVGEDGELVRREDPRRPDHEFLRGVLDGGAALLVPRDTRDVVARRWLTANGYREAIAVPLAGQGLAARVLVVADRMGDVRTFDSDDVRVLETVANHAGVTLQNRELIDRLRHEVLHDNLTGLPNRVFLQRRLRAVLGQMQAGRPGGAAVMILDLDEFKEINDVLGHHQGDLLLVEVAGRLRAAVSEAGIVARLGGDEFSVLLPDADHQQALRVAGRVLEALERPVRLDGLEVTVTAAVGVALAPAHGDDASGLLKRADVAMYGAKSSTRRLRLYEPELDTTDPRRLALVSEFRTALQTGGIEVHVQPQARLASGEVVGVEALARWHHPEFGWVPPDQFIPVAERSGLIGALTTHVLDSSLAAWTLWRAAGHDLSIAVNLSTRSLQDADLVDEVAGLLERHGVPAGRLTLEVTESSVMADPARAIAVLHQLGDLGVRLSVDDFGTGYSSLSYLKRLPVHEVKVDRSFVTELRDGHEDAAIVRAIVDLGRHLGLEVVAEGVEGQACWDLLASMGCHLVQGWYLARPMPPGELAAWLTIRTNAPARGGLYAV
ncbi:bifunctional diguanylate cyclase/phosphodiesterase [Blastococcus sp. CT_GayMR20]|uniref:putative bifunctional diguanylate cyclase/phosphodiesterase n=1 Tax=Blastococcus sp. CT_GayMR20 TaxID=2559609 RepID=UPI001072EE51|nr:bifunctional diguanylate cyclase/phosphodiesterase [Blastococcus sp. CT_GayMR20]TFV83349.1 bifunctional diguanylate cyclase/phosphodiesterase [Blastococcus sp. CT_GayMR20]